MVFFTSTICRQALKAVKDIRTFSSAINNTQIGATSAAIIPTKYPPFQKKFTSTTAPLLLVSINNNTTNTTTTPSTTLIQNHRSFSGVGGVTASSITPNDLSNEEIRALFHKWNNALSTLDPNIVTSRYAKTSILLPTVSNIPRTDHKSIHSYFVDFLTKKPQGIILESYILKGTDYVMDVGIYEFTFGSTGEKVKARYTFSYVYEDWEWKISHHHSSVMPE